MSLLTIAFWFTAGLTVGIVLGAFVITRATMRDELERERRLRALENARVHVRVVGSETELVQRFSDLARGRPPL